MRLKARAFAEGWIMRHWLEWPYERTLSDHRSLRRPVTGLSRGKLINVLTARLSLEMPVIT